LNDGDDQEEPMQPTAISAQDALWLTMDRPNNLMVIDTVVRFREVPDWDAVADVVRERLVERFPVFARVPVQREGRWYWEDDPAFDLAHHLVHWTLPHPGGVGDLQAYVAAQRSVPLDPSRPLWVMHLIDGVAYDDGDEGAALLGRFHHAIADGVRLVQVTLGLCDIPAEGTPAAVGRRLRRSTTPAAVAASATRNIGSAALDVATSSAQTLGRALTDALGTAQQVVGAQGGAAAGQVLRQGGDVVRAAGTVLRHPERLTDVTRLMSSPDNRVLNDAASLGKLALSRGSVETVWTGTPGMDKGATWATPLSLADVKKVRRATGTTVNDVLLATVAGTLTRYLREHGDDHVDEVAWMIPVSVKPLQQELPRELGNHFALVMLRMPLGIDDRRARLAEVHERMQRIKNSDEALLTFGVQRGISQAPDGVATAVTNFFANKAIGVLTNVPGPSQPMTLAGSLVDGVLGWAPCSGDQPMTICLFSYAGTVSAGFGTDRALVPDGDRLAELFALEFTETYDEIVGRVR
jgi:diacylglycerol O-acyltransferase